MPQPVDPPPEPEPESEPELALLPDEPPAQQQEAQLGVEATQNGHSPDPNPSSQA